MSTVATTARIPIENFGPAPSDWEECAICYGALEVAQDIIGHQPKIGDRHGFHENCLKTWLAVKRDCPSCRTPFQKELKKMTVVQKVKEYMNFVYNTGYIFQNVLLLSGFILLKYEEDVISETVSLVAQTVVLLAVLFT